jgi:hypothetical protein
MQAKRRAGNWIFELGDTGMPEAPVSGGTQKVASVGPAVHAAAKVARKAQWRRRTDWA